MKTRFFSTLLLVWATALSGSCGASPPSAKPPVADPPTTAHDGDGFALTAAKACADLAQLARLLDQAHPDAYMHVGRIGFQRILQRAVAAVPDEGMTPTELLRLARPLVAAVRDGHTTIWLAEGVRDTRRTWVELEVVDAGLHVTGVYGGERDLLGRRVVSIGGLPVATLLQRMAKLRGYDNDVGNLVHLADALRDVPLLVDLLEVEQVPDRLEIHVGSGRLFADISERPPGQLIVAASVVTLPETNAADMGWSFLDQERRIAFLRIRSMRRYREAFEVWRSSGFEATLDEHLAGVARAASGGKPPTGVAERIALVPSATAMLRDLVRAAADKGRCFWSICATTRVATPLSSPSSFTRCSAPRQC